MTETTNDQVITVDRSCGPECYVRINVTKNTKGYSYETTVSLRWKNIFGTDLLTMPDNDGTDAYYVESPTNRGGTLRRTATWMLEDLNQMADHVARDEIARRQQEDEGQS